MYFFHDNFLTCLQQFRSIIKIFFFQLSHQLSLFAVVRSRSPQNPEPEEPGRLAAAQHHSEARVRVAEEVGTILRKPSRSRNHFCESGKIIKIKYRSGHLAFCLKGYCQSSDLSMAIVGKSFQDLLFLTFWLLALYTQKKFKPRQIINYFILK